MSITWAARVGRQQVADLLLGGAVLASQVQVQAGDVAGGRVAARLTRALGSTIGACPDTGRRRLERLGTQLARRGRLSAGPFGLLCALLAPHFPELALGRRLIVAQRRRRPSLVAAAVALVPRAGS